MMQMMMMMMMMMMIVFVAKLWSFSVLTTLARKTWWTTLVLNDSLVKIGIQSMLSRYSPYQCPLQNFNRQREKLRVYTIHGTYMHAESHTNNLLMQSMLVAEFVLNPYFDSMTSQQIQTRNWFHHIMQIIYTVLKKTCCFCSVYIGMLLSIVYASQGFPPLKAMSVSRVTCHEWPANHAKTAIARLVVHQLNGPDSHHIQCTEAVTVRKEGNGRNP